MYQVVDTAIGPLGLDIFQAQAGGTTIGTTIQPTVLEDKLFIRHHVVIGRPTRIASISYGLSANSLGSVIILCTPQNQSRHVDYAEPVSPCFVVSPSLPAHDLSTFSFTRSFPPLYSCSFPYVFSLILADPFGLFLVLFSRDPDYVPHSHSM
jgi:hypothetical protein